MPTVTVKEDVNTFLNDLLEQCKPSRLSNVDSTFYEAFVWQEALKFAEKKYKDAMVAVAEAIEQTDDQLRRLDEGEHSVGAGAKFCVLAKISAPRSNFDKEGFIATVARKWKIPAAKLEVVAESSKKETKASLSKRVVEL